jgi:hypothetical protein
VKGESGDEGGCLGAVRTCARVALCSACKSIAAAVVELGKGFNAWKLAPHSLRFNVPAVSTCRPILWGNVEEMERVSSFRRVYRIAFRMMGMGMS